MKKEKLNSSIAIGAIWMVFMRLSVKGLGLISTLILARLLMPEDFGLMAIATSVYAFVMLLKAFGFDTAIIQKQNADKDFYNTAWTMGILLASLVSLILLGLAGYAASYFEDERLVNVFRMMALIVFVGGFANIGIVEFRKQLEFDKEFKYQLLIKVTSFITVIPFAYYLRSYWALLFGMLASSVATLILSYVMQAYRPRLSLSSAKDLFGFSSWLFINNILLYVNNHTQNLMLGKLLGAKEVGIYSISNELSTITSAEMVAPVNRAAFPGYSKISDNTSELKNTYLNVVAYIFFLAAPSCIGLAAIAPVMVPVVLGDKWIEAIVIIQILAFADLLVAINTNSAYIYMARAKQKLTTILLSIKLLVYLPLLFWLSMKNGVVGAAQATFCGTLILFPINHLFLRKEIGMTLKDVFLFAYRPLLSAALMYYSVQQYISYVGEQGEVNVWVLFLCLLIGFFVYVASTLTLWWATGKKDGPEQFLLDKVLKTLKLKAS